MTDPDHSRRRSPLDPYPPGATPPRQRRPDPPDQAFYPDRPVRWSVDASRLWAGGTATAVVAALVALVGLLIARGVLDLPVFDDRDDGIFGDSATVGYLVSAFLAALIATAALQLLIATTPQPESFFTWIVALVTAGAALAPFLDYADLGAAIAVAVTNIVIGICIDSLLCAVASRTIRLT